MEKKCTKCGGVKPATDYYLSYKTETARASQCKICSSDGAKKWRNENRKRVNELALKRYHSDPKKQRANSLKYFYGLTLSDFNSLAEKQGNQCAICREILILNVDHCHKTGKIRGLLCQHCNRGLGGFKDSIEKLTAAISYLTVNQMDEPKSGVDETVDSPHSS